MSVLISISDWFVKVFTSVPRLIACSVGILWAHISPTLPYALICVFAVILDCITAYRLHRRIALNFPKSGADGKLKSSHMSRMVSDLLVVWLCMLLARELDYTLLSHLGVLHLDQYVGVLFCSCQFVSILENESSCNGAAWAKVAQRFLANKVSRHIEMSETAFEELLNERRKSEKADSAD